MAGKKGSRKKKAARSKVEEGPEEIPAPTRQATDFTPEVLGREARALLENETFILALNYVESRALAECRSAQSAEESFRGTLKSQAVQDIRATLHAYIAQGESEAARASRARESARESNEQDELYRSYMMAAQAARDAADSDEQLTNGNGRR